MADPLNLSDLESLFSPDRKPKFVGRPEGYWERTGILMCENYAYVADNDCRGLVGCVLELQRDDFWRQYSDNWDEFCQQVFHRPAAWIEQVVEGVRVLHLRGEKGKVGAGQALAAHQTAQAALALEGTFAKAGDNQHTPKEGGSDNHRPSLKGLSPAQGTSAAYLAARLKKAEREDLLQEIGPGKRFKSVRAAAIEAGIIKPVPVASLVDDPVKAAASMLKKMGPGWCQQLVVALTCQQTAAS